MGFHAVGAALSEKRLWFGGLCEMGGNRNLTRDDIGVILLCLEDWSVIVLCETALREVEAEDKTFNGGGG